MQSIKRNWGFIAVVFLAFVLGMLINGQRVESQSGQAGRYLLCEGHYSHYSTVSNVSLDSVSIFKIDTVTGKAWYFTSGVTKDDEMVKFWVPIE